MPTNHSPERSHLQLQYGFNLYDYSMARYRALDGKAARSFPAYAFVLTLMGFLTTQLDADVLSGLPGCLVVSFVGLAFICAVGGMACLVRAMATRPTVALPIARETFDALQNTPVPELSYEFASSALNAARIVDCESNKKAKLIDVGLWLWIGTTVLVLLSAALFASLRVGVEQSLAQPGPSHTSRHSGVTDNQKNDAKGKDQTPTKGQGKTPSSDKATGDAPAKPSVGPLRVLRESQEHTNRPPEPDD